MKKTYQPFVYVIGIFFFICPKIQAQDDTKFLSNNPMYMGLFGQLEIPIGSLNEYSNVRGGFRIEAGKSFTNKSPVSAGLFISGIFSSKNKDTFKGIEVETVTTLFDIHPFLRWSPINNKSINPYFEGSAGLSIVNTQTISEVVNYPTFLDQVLFGNVNPQMETTTHMDNTSVNFAYSIGAGVILKKILLIGVRYQHTNPVEFIDQNEVFIENNSIQYEVKKIPLDMIVLTIGVTFLSLQ